MYKIYLFRQLEQITEEFIDRSLALLPEERRQKALRYRRMTDRKNCVITYLMLKIALRECFQITSFTLGYEENGKPCLAEYPNIYFNISHCQYGCVVAVADTPVGVDIQEVRPFSWEVAKRVCSKEELELLERSSDRDREFTRMWIMKESYAKMTGEGIRGNLAEINILKDLGETDLAFIFLDS